MRQHLHVKYRGNRRLYQHANHEYTVTPMDGGYDVGVDGDFLASFPTLEDAEAYIVSHTTTEDME